MVMRKFDVRIGSKLVEQVFYLDDMTAKEVRKSLINHDGMPANISVYKNSKNGRAYEDVARVSHPEEC